MNDIIKIRPNMGIKYSYGTDGRDDCYYIEYTCPCCGRIISGYKKENACNKCGTFYDWGDREPKIVLTRSVEWE